jgi:hypothetical protein
MDIPDPIQRAKDRYADMAAGAEASVAPAQVTGALEQALQNKEGGLGGLGGRSLGFAVIDSQQKGDGANYRVLVTDGEQHGVIVARLSGTLLSMLAARGTDENDHLVERLQNATGSLPNDGNRWLNIVLQDEPLSFHAG